MGVPSPPGALKANAMETSVKAVNSLHSIGGMTGRGDLHWAGRASDTSRLTDVVPCVLSTTIQLLPVGEVDGGGRWVFVFFVFENIARSRMGLRTHLEREAGRPIEKQIVIV